MLAVSRIRLDFGERRLFDDLSLRLGDRDRTALIGPNGSGKTTLLRILAGELAPDAGEVARDRGATVGWLPQSGVVHAGRSILDEARSAFDEALALRRESDEIEVRMERGEADAEEIARHGDLLRRFRESGGFEVDARVSEVLDGLGFPRDERAKDAGTLSGGWQMRLALAKLLLRRPDVLLLDEPTNHLDLLANNWLEETLRTWPGSFLLVSHDRHFLDNVVTHVAELRGGTLRVFTGNYSAWTAQSAAEKERLEERKRRQDEEIARTERFIERFRYKNTKARQVQSRIKQLEKVDRIEIDRDAASVRFRFPEPPRSGRIVLDLRGVRKRYDGLVVFRGLDLAVERGDRLALVGENGAGKSTLMRILAGRECFEGERRVGHAVSLAFFAQDEASTLDPRATVLEEVSRAAPFDMVPKLRGLLGAFLFRGDDVHKPVSVLSGGERMRVALARMLLEPHNVLLLDEPTNHLDLASKEVLVNALRDYTGTLVFVSHDRWFIDQLANRIADVGGGGAELYPGGYEEFLARAASPFRAVGSFRDGAPGASPSAGAAAAVPAPARGASEDPRRERKEAERAARKSGKDRARLESRIEAIEAEVRALEARMSEPGFFSDGAAAREAVQRHAELRDEARRLYDEWAALVS